MSSYKTDTIERHGVTYEIEWIADDCADAPWENSDCHGPVSDWERRSKRPNEMILNTDRGFSRFYDFQEAMRIAKRDRWNCAKNGEELQEAVFQDYKYLKDWCDDKWFYCGIVVTRCDTGESDSLWGIESEGDHSWVLNDLISGLSIAA